MVGEEKRHQMMQNLFGDQSEEEEEDEEEDDDEPEPEPDVESEHESNRQPTDYNSDEGDVGLKPDVEDAVEGEGEADVDSDEELRGADHDPVESDNEQGRNSDELDQRDQSEGKDSGTDEREEYNQRVVTSRRNDVVESESERSEENHFVDNEDEDIDQTRSPRSPEEKRNEAQLPLTAPELRDVFGESDEDDEPVEYARVQNHQEHDSNISPREEEEEIFEKQLRPEDMLADEDDTYASEEDNVDAKVKERPVGPPMDLEIQWRDAPPKSEKMTMIKVSNIMGIDPNEFDHKKYVERDRSRTDESDQRKGIRLEDNIIRYRTVRDAAGKQSYESNARFVNWSDGSWQLLIGNEVLDVSIQDAQHEQAHLFVRHEKGILQGHGRVLRKMRFLPSSLTSNSHRLLTALVDSRHKKVYKVKNCVTEIDPEREKEQREKAESQNIRANELLSRKKEKVSRKYTTPRKERQLSPGFLEDALEEDEEQDYYDSRRSSARRFEEDLEMEARAEKRIINAKKGQKDTPRKASLSSGKFSRRPADDYESEKEESEYETEEEEEEELSPPRKRAHEPDPDDEDEEEQLDEGVELADEASDEEVEEFNQKSKESRSSLKRKEIESDDDSPPRKITTHRRKALVLESDEE